MDEIVTDLTEFFKLRLKASLEEEKKKFLQQADKEADRIIAEFIGKIKINIHERQRLYDRVNEYELNVNIKNENQEEKIK